MEILFIRRLVIVSAIILLFSPRLAQQRDYLRLYFFLTKISESLKKINNAIWQFQIFTRV